MLIVNIKLLEHVIGRVFFRICRKKKILVILHLECHKTLYSNLVEKLTLKMIYYSFNRAYYSIFNLNCGENIIVQE
jgi:hypothetical protein